MTEGLLRDDVVVLAGATGNVGGATLRALIAHGARVAVVSRSAATANKTIANELESEVRARAIGIEADLRDPASATRAVAAAIERFGRLDAVVSLAGGRVFVPIVESTLADLEENLGVNLITNYNLMTAALRALLAQPSNPDALSRGRLVAVSAGSSKTPQPRFGLFGASKAALNVFMQGIAREHKADGIVSNVVVLGGVATDAARGYLDPAGFEAAARPQEVAEVLAFLASRHATGINGALVDVNAREVD